MSALREFPALVGAIRDQGEDEMTLAAYDQKALG
jgi:hypothetical protein